MAMPEKMPEHIWAFVGASFQGLWIQCAKPETTPYIRSDLVENLVKALEDARRDMRNAWGAVTSNQVEDKDVAGGLRSAMGRIDAALARIKGD